MIIDFAIAGISIIIAKVDSLPAPEISMM